MAKKKGWQELLLKNQTEGVKGTSNDRENYRKMIEFSTESGSSITPTLADKVYNPIKAGLNAVREGYQHVVTDTKATQVEVGPLNKLWRARILLNRAASNMEQADTIDEISSKYQKPKTTSDSRKARDNKWKISQSASSLTSENKLLELWGNRESTKVFSNKIVIVNESSKPLAKVEIQYFTNVEMNPEASWAVVKSMGRNNPFYMFTGSEDTISFEISWRTLQDNREDVLNKCRLLESWTKADGYDAAPPVLGISWGSSNIFAGDHFILKSAPYKPNSFQNSYRKGPRNGTNEIIDLGLLPNAATQTLTFCRVTSGNRTREDIIAKAKLKATRGVTLL